MGAYYTPPGGDITAAYGRSLMGALPINPRIYRRHLMPPSVLYASALAARQASPVTMTGMGIFPSVNVRYAKSAIPAALASRRWREMHPEDLQLRGLGAARAGGGKIIIARPGAAMLVSAARGGAFGSRAGATGGSFPGFTVPRGRPADVISPNIPRIQRQSGFFMGPGGGPGGGPFRIPGYSMSGLGLLSDDMPPPDVPLQPLGPPPSWITITSEPAPPTPAQIIAAATPSNVNVSTTPTYNFPALTPPASSTAPRIYAPPPPPPGPGFLQQSTLGVPNRYLLLGLGTIVGLAALRRRR